LKQTYNLDISGIVQGVGFRPFLYNLAQKYGLKGQVVNRGNAGVRLKLQCDPSELKSFLRAIEKEKPNIAYIENLLVEEIESEEIYTDFTIGKSEEGRGISLTLPPDIAICEDCLKDMRNLNLPKYYNYPFIACAVCGPRYTTVKALPYDRERTTMTIFPFCTSAVPESCRKEYSDYNNRRFHAQTFACSVCGPSYQLYDNSHEQIQTNSIAELLETSVKFLKEGQILAVKGIGGVHLVCLANDDEVILKLRKRKGKSKNKPFAIMVPNLEMIKDYYEITDYERDILTSFRRPIVLLERKKKNDPLLSSYISPGLNNVGFMLPYSGIHYLLFDYLKQQPLVYTSGNKSSLPMAIENEEIFKDLEHLADSFLLHDRPIYQRADDSVLRVHEDIIKLIRRSRGYVPEYIPLPFDVNIPAAIATGPELSVTGAILRRNRIFPTQHIGHVINLETHNFLRDALFHVKDLLQIKDEELKFIACDAHPLFTTTKLAKELALHFGVKCHPIQHHYAHVLSLMAEKKVSNDEKIVGICTDGVGYGLDGHVWGGEILSCSYHDFSRKAHLMYQPMIGGDRCTKFPARMLASIVLNSYSIEESRRIFNIMNISKDLEYGSEELNAMITQFEKSKVGNEFQNLPLSSSTGRIFDAVSYLLNACTLKTYRGEPAMRLEGLASRGNPNGIKLSIKIGKKDGQHILDSSSLIFNVIELLGEKKNKPEDIAAAFHKELGKTFANVALKIAKCEGMNKIGLTGGVAYNKLFSQNVKDTIIKEGYIFLEHEIIPPGDAGISIGQLVGGYFKQDH
jgi:hydrogenase maturation protein HypF